VNPGNIVVADAAGVVIVPQDIAHELLHRLNAYRAANADYPADLKREGKFSNAWVDSLPRPAAVPSRALPCRSLPSQMQDRSKRMLSSNGTHGATRRRNDNAETDMLLDPLMIGLPGKGQT
jgi:hypothetical protein